MNCILPWARPRPAVVLMLLLTLVHQTTSSNVALQQLDELEDDKGKNVAKQPQSQLRNKPRQAKVEVEAKEDKALTSTLQAHAQFFEGDKDFFEFESEQELQMTKRDLSIFDATEETANVEFESTPVIVGDGVYCNDTLDECNLDVDLDKDCEWVVDEETEALVCFRQMSMMPIPSITRTIHRSTLM